MNQAPGLQVLCPLGWGSQVLTSTATGETLGPDLHMPTAFPQAGAVLAFACAFEVLPSVFPSPLGAHYPETLLSIPAPLPWFQGWPHSIFCSMCRATLSSLAVPSDHLTTVSIGLNICSAPWSCLGRVRWESWCPRQLRRVGRSSGERQAWPGAEGHHTADCRLQHWAHPSRNQL